MIDMVSKCQIFGMHKAGTSFLMKSLCHFCHQNKMALASSPNGFLPIDAFKKKGGDMDGDIIDRDYNKFFSLYFEKWEKYAQYTRNDFNFSIKEYLDYRLSTLDVYITGNTTNKKRIYFYRNSSLDVYQLNREIPSIRVIRNPLSIVKSAYFSHLNTHKTKEWSRLDEQRNLLKNCSLEEGMWKTYFFLKSDVFYPFTDGPLLTLDNWSTKIGNAKILRMEDITIQPQKFLEFLWQILGGKEEDLIQVPIKFLTFEYQSGGRKIGEVDSSSHLRSGDPEEWRDLLPKNLITQIRNDYYFLLKEFYPESL